MKYFDRLNSFLKFSNFSQTSESMNVKFETHKYHLHLELSIDLHVDRDNSSMHLFVINTRAGVELIFKWCSLLINDNTAEIMTESTRSPTPVRYTLNNLADLPDVSACSCDHFTIRFVKIRILNQNRNYRSQNTLAFKQIIKLKKFKMK